MSKMKTFEDEKAALTAVLLAHTQARSEGAEFKVEEAFDILFEHGFYLIDVRLYDVLDDLPVGLDDLIEDYEDEAEEDEVED